GATLAYRGHRIPAGRAGLEYVAYAHGSGADDLGGQMVEQIRAWDQAGQPTPVLHVFPAGTLDAELPEGRVLDEQHSRLVLTWPKPGTHHDGLALVMTAGWGPSSARISTRSVRRSS